jgi:hypothetical protein
MLAEASNPAKLERESGEATAMAKRRFAINQLNETPDRA